MYLCATLTGQPYSRNITQSKFYCVILLSANFTWGIRIVRSLGPIVQLSSSVGVEPATIQSWCAIPLRHSLSFWETGRHIITISLVIEEEYPTNSTLRGITVVQMKSFYLFIKREIWRWFSTVPKEKNIECGKTML